MILKFFSYTLTFLFFLSCTNKKVDYYFLDKDESADIGYPYGSIIYKSSKKNYFENILIYSDINQVEFGQKYIIVNQHPNKELMLKKMEDDFNIWSNYYSENKKDSIVNLSFSKISLKEIFKLGEANNKKFIKVADSILLNDRFNKIIFSNKENYYIIDKEKDKMYGPLTFSEFRKLKTSLKITLDFK